MRLKYVLILATLPVFLAGTANAEECDPNDPTLLKPDLFSLAPSRIRVAEQNGHRMVFFTTTIGNKGDGPLILHGKNVQGPSAPETQAIQEILRSDGTSCTRVGGLFEVHSSHRHFHFEDFSDYLLRKDDPFTGEIVARSSKVSFCLLDILRLPGYRTYPTVPNDCLNAEGTQGISVGFADVYDSLLPGQFIDLDANGFLPAGNYFLVNVVNPDKLIWETNDDPQENAGFVSVGIGTHAAPRQRPPGGVHLPRPPHNPGGPVLAPRPRHPHAPHSPRG